MICNVPFAMYLCRKLWTEMTIVVLNSNSNPLQKFCLHTFSFVTFQTRSLVTKVKLINGTFPKRDTQVVEQIFKHFPLSISPGVNISGPSASLHFPKKILSRAFQYDEFSWEHASLWTVEIDGFSKSAAWNKLWWVTGLWLGFPFHRCIYEAKDRLIVWF